MLQRSLGTTTVGAIGLGGAGFSFNPDRRDDNARATIEAALAAGVTYLDTAAAYTTLDEPRHNELLISRVLRELGQPADVIVGTKGGHHRDGESWPIDGRPESIRADCEGSLLALGRDSLDLYFLHWPDPHVDFAESVGALEELRTEGKIQRVGVSNVTPELLRIADSTTRLSAIQNYFSPFETRDRALMTDCASRGILYFAYSPLGGGRSLPRSVELPRTAEHARQLGVNVERIILAWELSIATSVVAISGSSRPATVVDAAAAGELTLDQETIAAIEADVLDLGRTTN